MQLAPLVAHIDSLRRTAAPTRSLLVALTGIDACGKGFAAGQLRGALEAAGLRTAVIGVDGWLNPPQVRFSTRDPGEHFYRHALRLDELFGELVLPLRAARSLSVEVAQITETATHPHREVLEFHDLDVILLEGIFLLKRELQDGRYDLAVWIECSFETALARALARGQEGLSAADTRHAYRTIYWPAQELHLARDRPREAADVMLVNDPRSAPPIQPLQPPRASTQTLR